MLELHQHRTAEEGYNSLYQYGFGPYTNSDDQKHEDTGRKSCHSQRHPVHFGTLMDLCHVKHAELACLVETMSKTNQDAKRYLENKVLSLLKWQQQESSTLPETAGEAHDAAEPPSVWARLPRNRHPANWDKIKDPVVRLEKIWPSIAWFTVGTRTRRFPPARKFG